MENVFPLYKPKGPTSFAMIAQLRRILGVKKIGHAGTLDPLAEGVLVVAVGRDGTKQLTGLIRKEKEYVATIKLGVISSTDDEEGEKSEQEVAEKPKAQVVKNVLKQFVGEIDQVPPIFSALKIKGKPAYKYARAGKEIKMEARKVKIDKIELLKYKWPELKIRVVCGSGVYIRSLARDIGHALSVGGYLIGLTRTRVGNFTLEKCVSLEQLTADAVPPVLNTEPR